MPTFYEFFCGGGMARAGLGDTWQCAFANDFDQKKSKTYRDNWGADELLTCDVGLIQTSEIPGRADLAWASFPCQDLSLAGGGAGLAGERSGTFRPFWNLMLELAKESRLPPVVVLENVCGTLTSHGGKDFSVICGDLAGAGYRLGALVIDAAMFVPQSRPRLFVIGVLSGLETPESVVTDGPCAPWHTPAIMAAHARLPESVRQKWIWWSPSLPAARTKGLSDIIEESPDDVDWLSPADAERLISMMSEANKAKLAHAKALGRRVVGTIYKRTRDDGGGGKAQRAEVRFDNIAGCLRTPAGGSSRQLVVIVEGESVRVRLVSSRETARLMGLAEDYKLPANYNEAYHLTGDGVVVPVVRHIATNILDPLLSEQAEPLPVAV